MTFSSIESELLHVLAFCECATILECCLLNFSRKTKSHLFCISQTMAQAARVVGAVSSRTIRPS